MQLPTCGMHRCACLPHATYDRQRATAHVQKGMCSTQRGRWHLALRCIRQSSHSSTPSINSRKKSLASAQKRKSKCVTARLCVFVCITSQHGSAHVAAMAHEVHRITGAARGRWMRTWTSCSARICFARSSARWWRWAKARRSFRSVTAACHAVEAMTALRCLRYRTVSDVSEWVGAVRSVRLP